MPEADLSGRHVLVIATNYGGSTELILDAVTGYLVNAYDFVDLSEKINVLLNDDNKRLSMGKASKLRVQSEFSIDKMVASFYNEYKNLTESVLA